MTDFVAFNAIVEKLNKCIKLYYVADEEGRKSCMNDITKIIYAATQYTIDDRVEWVVEVVEHIKEEIDNQATLLKYRLSKYTDAYVSADENERLELMNSIRVDIENTTKLSTEDRSQVLADVVKSLEQATLEEKV